MSSTETHPAEQRAQANRDLAREHGNHVDLIADIAELQIGVAEREREDRNRLEDGLQVLRFLAVAPWSDRTLEIDRVLHDGHGSICGEKVDEYVGLLLSGKSSLEARKSMVAATPKRSEHSQSMRDAVAAARLVSANLHHMAEAPKVQPALPAGPVAVNGRAQLPRRTPIAPAQPPMVPPAPPEGPAEQTGQMVAVVQEAAATGRISPKSVQALTQAGFGAAAPVAGPDFGPRPDPRFAAAAVPAQRLGDTVTMHADEVLAELAKDDASEVDGADGTPSGPRPFSEADTAKRSGAASGRDAGDDH